MLTCIVLYAEGVDIDASLTPRARHWCDWILPQVGKYDQPRANEFIQIVPSVQSWAPHWFVAFRAAAKQEWQRGGELALAPKPDHRQGAYGWIAERQELSAEEELEYVDLEQIEDDVYH